jgi:hypothetical protein
MSPARWHLVRFPRCSTSNRRGEAKGRKEGARPTGHDRVHEPRSDPHTRCSHHLSSSARLVRLNNRIDDILRLVVAQSSEIISDVGDVITTRVVRLAGVHRVMGAIGVSGCITLLRACFSRWDSWTTGAGLRGVGGRAKAQPTGSYIRVSFDPTNAMYQGSHITVIAVVLAHLARGSSGR